MRGIRKQAQHDTLAMQKHALVGETYSDFKVGDLVMTVDGLPGRVAAVNYGPYPSTEDYEVVLDNNMGGGTYNSGQLTPYHANTASRVEAAEVLASIPVEAVTEHSANIDYPELENILSERLPNENIKVFAHKRAVNSTQQDDTDDDESEKLTQQSHDPDDDKDPSGVEEGLPTDEPVDDNEEEGDSPNVTPPSACSFCGGTDFEDPQMTGRGVRMRCSQCKGTMKSWGGQWEPEFPNSSQNNASEQGDMRSGGAAGVANLPDANFKTTSLDTTAGIVNWIVDKIYDRIQERQERDFDGKDWAAPARDSQVQGPAHYDVHYPWVDVPQRHPNGLTIQSGLDDSEWGFHLTATWFDVQAKARRIRSEGGVKIVSASKLYVVGEVQGDTNTYESQLNYVPGSKKVADWACGCKWASYTWGRSPSFRRFEGRLCSHALALQYEAGGRGMFGREVTPDKHRGSEPVSVKWDKLNEEHLTRASSLFDSDGIYPEPQALDLINPPIYAFAVNMLDHEESVAAVIQMFASFGVGREDARAMTHEAMAEPPLAGAESHAERHLAAGWSTYITNEDESVLEPHTAVGELTQMADDERAKKRKKKHKPNDAREHAHIFGYGWPVGLALMNCGQCNGQGCGHCAGTGQVPSADENTPTQSPSMSTPDQTPDAGDAISSDGVSASLRTQADYSSADPLVSVDQGQNYYSPIPHSHSQNPASTGWATSQDPGDWGRSLISNNFGVTFDASLHTSAAASDPMEGPTVSGVALKAADTGRVLMIQRSIHNDDDPAKGTWEFPGGHHEEEDPTSLHAGIREWEEEVGQPFPHGGHVSHVWRSGPYQGHVVVIPEEKQVPLHEGRTTVNPDDPDGDDHEQSAWWDPTHATKIPNLRSELKKTNPFGEIKKAAKLDDHPSIWDVNEDNEQDITEPKQEMHEATLHDDPEGALPTTDGLVDDDTGFALDNQNSDDVSSQLAGNSVDRPHVGADDAESIRMAFLQSKGALALADGDVNTLRKAAMKEFSFAEQQELINEGKGDRARNFDDLKIAGTHYEMIPDDADDTILWV